jgi:regulator of cell morphogenesis and NO signaling
MPATINQTVRDLAASVPGATRVFERAGIDYCCGGGLTLEDACATAGVSPGEMLVALQALEANDPTLGGEPDFGAMPLGEIVDHIVRTHHVFTREELARLEELLAKVRSKHEPNHSELADVGNAFNRLLLDLLPHMQKEERVLFPYIGELENAWRQNRPAAPPPFLTVKNPIRMMMLEHDAAGDYLREIRTATANFKIPDDACTSFRALYEGLEGLERDLHQHIHLENNVLFPRATAMENDT